MAVPMLYRDRQFDEAFWKLTIEPMVRALSASKLRSISV
jgi:hypothetical protein